MRRSLALLAVGSLALLAPACSDDGSDDGTTTTTSSSTSSTASTTSTSGAGGASTSSTSAAGTGTGTAFPPDRTTLEHAGTTWAVVLAGAEDPGAPAIERAVQAAADAGYTTGPGDCDVGAAKALDLGDDGTGIYTVSVYFDTQAQAEQALTAFHEHGYEGGAVAQLETYCLD